MKRLKIIFAGTEKFSAKYLSSLIYSLYDVILVISQPDQCFGRGQKVNFSPVKILSKENNIPILQPVDLNEKQFKYNLLQFHADIMIVVSYGKMIPKQIINMFPKGCINVHPSLLPRWRGSTPIQSSILNGDKKTGVSIIKMNDKIDSGNIINQIKCSISSKDTTQSLSLKLVKIGITALFEVLHNIITNTIIEKKQNEKYATFSKKILKKDALLDWNVTAKELERLIRAFNPWPICFFIMQNNAIRVWQAQVINTDQNLNFSIGEIIYANSNGIQINTSCKILNIQKLQFPGKKVMHVKDVLLSKKNWFKKGIII